MSTDQNTDVPGEETGSRLLTRLGIGSSIIVHIAVLAWIVFGTGVRLYNPSPTEAIAVELVTPEEAEPKTKDEAKDKPDETKENKRNETLTQLDLTIPKPSLDDAVKTSQATAAAKQEAPAPAKQATKSQQAAASQSPPQATSPPPVAPAAPPAASPPPAPASQQAAASFTANAPPVAEPDITEKYGTMFGLSDTGYSGDTMAAKIEASAVDTFRAHLRKCSQIPANITAADKVKIVLRVALSPTGNLITTPALIEASASPKGPYLMQAAIKALQACQPYDMLPADKYKEWRVLDLSFTPQDFGAG